MINKFTDQGQRRRLAALLVVIMVILTVFFCCGGSGPEEKNMNTLEELSMIRTGTYQGECFIHCNEALIVTPAKTSYALTSNVQDPQNPDITIEQETERSDWEELRALVDWARLIKLPSQIGQPDASDQGGEWVEITVGETAKRIDFEMHAPVPEIDVLLLKLRKMRKAISGK